MTDVPFFETWFEVTPANPSGYWLIPQKSSNPGEWAAMELANPVAEIARLKTELAEARREWTKLALHIAQHLDPECADAEWGDIVGTFDPWDCVLSTADKLAEAKELEDLQRRTLKASKLEDLQHIAALEQELAEAVELLRTSIGLLDVGCAHGHNLYQDIEAFCAAIDDAQNQERNKA